MLFNRRKSAKELTDELTRLKTRILSYDSDMNGTDGETPESPTGDDYNELWSEVTHTLKRLGIMAEGEEKDFPTYESTFDRNNR